MDLSSGYPLSLVKNGLPYEYPQLQKDIRTTVAVIGAGISGALTAYALANAGLPCTVVDARTVGLGSTCASTSLLQYEIDVPLVRLVEKIGKAAAERAYALCAASVGTLENICGRLNAGLFQQKNSLLLASFKKDLPLLEAEFKARNVMGLPVDWWGAEDVKHNMGLEHPAAIFSGAAGQTDAYLLTHALHQHNLRKGAQVYDRTLVKDIRFHKQGAELLTANGAVVRSRYIVVATGYEALQYVPAKIVKLQSTYAVAGGHRNGGSAWYRDCLIWETKQPYLYMRTAPDGRVIAGGRDEDYYNPHRRDKLLPLKTRQLAKDVRSRFPQLNFHPEFAWTGTFGSTQDGLPYIGEYHGMPHTYFALGFGGNGITFSQVAAEIVCGLIMEGKHPDAELFSFNRWKG